MSTPNHTHPTAATTIDEQGFVEISLDTGVADITQPLPDTARTPEPVATAASVSPEAKLQTPAAKSTDLIPAPKLITATASKAQEPKSENPNESNTKSAEAQNSSKPGRHTTDIKQPVAVVTNKLQPLTSAARRILMSLVKRSITLLKTLGVGSAKHSSRAMKAFSGFGAGLLVLAFLVLFFRPLISLILVLMAAVQLGMAGMISRTDS